MKPTPRQTTFVSLALILAFAVLAGVVRWAATPAPVSRMEHQQQMKNREVQLRFQQAVVMLHGRQYDHAVTALHRVLELAPRMPEAHVNMGYAFLGLHRADAARCFFQSAIELRPQQANAYYGLALAWEATGDLAMATGAMRSYLHLARTVCRRGERLMVELADQPGESVSKAALKYVNRLSDFLFVASRFANDKGAADVMWVPGQNR